MAWKQPPNAPTAQGRETAARKRSRDLGHPRPRNPNPEPEAPRGRVPGNASPPFSSNPAHWARPIPPATHRIRFPHNGAKSSGESLGEGLAVGSVWWAFFRGSPGAKGPKGTLYGSLPSPPPRHKLASSDHRTSRLPPESSQSVVVPPTTKSLRPYSAFGTSAHVVAVRPLPVWKSYLKSSVLPTR